MNDYGFLILTVLPVILLAIWAAYVLSTRKTKRRGSMGRDDRSEPTELTGPEQHKRREMP